MMTPARNTCAAPISSSRGIRLPFSISEIRRPEVPSLLATAALDSPAALRSSRSVAEMEARCGSGAAIG